MSTEAAQAQLAQLPRTAASTRLLKQLADFNQRGKDDAAANR